MAARQLRHPVRRTVIPFLGLGPSVALAIGEKSALARGRIRDGFDVILGKTLKAGGFVPSVCIRAHDENICRTLPCVKKGLDDDLWTEHSVRLDKPTCETVLLRS